VSDLAGCAVAPEPGALSYDGLKRGLREAIARDPLEATVATVLGGALLFYVAEKGHNPKVRTYWDALVFISTCLSVGYADVFARTPAGKAIAAAVMTIGPAMSGAILDRPASVQLAADADANAQALAAQRIIADKLDALLAELRAQRVDK
jgi:hypothetical protein